MSGKTSKAVNIAAIMICIVFGYVIISQGKPILMPLVVAAFIAIIINPIIEWLEKFKMHRALGVTIVLMILILTLPLFGFMLFKQGEAIAEDLPAISEKVNGLYQNIVEFADETFGVDAGEQAEYIQSGLQRLLSGSGSMLQSTLNTTVNLLGYVALIPIYIFFMILYRHRFREFAVAVSKPDKRERVDQVIDQAAGVVQKYVAGLAMVITIVATLNVTGLLVLGIPYAVFFGVLAALLNVIPYIGVLIGSIPPVLIALLMTDSLFYPLAVIGLLVVVQTLDNNLITPNVSGSQVSINPLAAIIALMIGGFLWGAIGMILAIPAVGVVKVVVGAMQGGRPWAEILS